MNQELVLKELYALREQVAGVRDTAVASVDGMLVASDTDKVRPDVLAALASAALGLGKSTTHEVGMGELREVVTRCQFGYVVIYAVGKRALLVVLGDEGLDLTRLHLKSRATTERLVEHLSS